MPNIDANGIRIVKRFQPIARVSVHRTKLIHVLINVIKNAEAALATTPVADRAIAFEIGRDPQGRAVLSVRDTGEGITAVNLAQVFSHGFTTKPTGHGFGLHTCANAMVEMGGVITAASAGPGLGAAFTLTFGVDAGAEDAGSRASDATAATDDPVRPSSSAGAAVA